MNPPPVTDWRLWLVAAVAVGSLLLGIWNAVQTSRLKKLEGRLRKFTIRLDEFRTQVRDPIRASVSEIGPLARRLEAIAKTRSSINDHADELAEANGEVVSTLGSISDALDGANRSSFAEGQDWQDLVVASEDATAEGFNTARDDTQPQATRLKAVQSIAEELLKLRSVINEKLDEALVTFERVSEAP